MNQTTKTLLQALIDGKTVQMYRNYNTTFVDLSPEEALQFLASDREDRMRVKPDTTRIGEFDVPKLAVPC